MVLIEKVKEILKELYIEAQWKTILLAFRECLPEKKDVRKIISTKEEQWERRYDIGYNAAIDEIKARLK